MNAKEFAVYFSSSSIFTFCLHFFHVSRFLWLFLSCRFSQQFIDIRENERKRSQRGVISVPPKVDEEKLLQNDTTNATTPIPPTRVENNSPGFKTEHLLELQEKITKEILSTKLNENEMHALQVTHRAKHIDNGQQMNFYKKSFIICIHPGEDQPWNSEFESFQFGKSSILRWKFQKTTARNKCGRFTESL